MYLGIICMYSQEMINKICKTCYYALNICMLQLIPSPAPRPDAVVANEVEATTSSSSFSSSS